MDRADRVPIVIPALHGTGRDPIGRRVRGTFFSCRRSMPGPGCAPACPFRRSPKPAVPAPAGPKPLSASLMRGLMARISRRNSPASGRGIRSGCRRLRSRENLRSSIYQESLESSGILWQNACAEEKLRSDVPNIGSEAQHDLRKTITHGCQTQTAPAEKKTTTPRMRRKRKRKTT